MKPKLGCSLQKGREVIFIEVLDEFMADVGFLDRIAYGGRLAKQKISIHTGKRVGTVLDKRAVIVNKYGKRDEILADNIVVAVGFHLFRM